jgi:hypothetical protein
MLDTKVLFQPIEGHYALRTSPAPPPPLKTVDPVDSVDSVDPVDPVDSPSENGVGSMAVYGNDSSHRPTQLIDTTASYSPTVYESIESTGSTPDATNGAHCEATVKTDAADAIPIPPPDCGPEDRPRPVKLYPCDPCRICSWELAWANAAGQPVCARCHPQPLENRV